MATTKLRLRPDRKMRSNQLSVYVQVCIKSRVKLFPTGVKVEEVNWDSKKQRVRKVSGSNGHVKINIILNKKHQEIKDIITKLILEERLITFELLANEMEGNEIDDTVFSYWFDRFVDEQVRKVKRNTVKNYNVLRNQIMDFRRGKDFEVSMIDLEFYTKFRNWLLDERGQNNSTVNKRLKTLKTFLRYCGDFEAYDVSKLNRFRMLEEYSSNKIALTEVELELLRGFDFSKNKRLERVRDIFVVACYTGMRISDVCNLSKASVKDGFITLNVIKTNRDAEIPLTKVVLEILEKYDYVLHKISGQKINNYLKEIGQECGISDPEIVVQFKGGDRIEREVPKYELLSSHVGRRTFITLSILKGIPTPVIQSITGHNDLRSFQKYIQLKKHDKLAAMQLWE